MSLERCNNVSVPPSAQSQRSAAWMQHGEGTLSCGLDPSSLSEASAAGALQLVVRRQAAQSNFKRFFSAAQSRKYRLIRF